MWIAVAIVAALLGGLGLLLWQGARERREAKRELDRIKALSPPEARTMALQLLGDPELFQCKAVSATDPLPTLPQSVTDLLTRYDEIIHGEFWIGRSALVQPARKAGYRRSVRTSSSPSCLSGLILKPSTCHTVSNHQTRSPKPSQPRGT
jgi:hypothetical protein